MNNQQPTDIPAPRQTTIGFGGVNSSGVVDWRLLPNALSIAFERRGDDELREATAVPIQPELQPHPTNDSVQILSTNNYQIHLRRDQLDEGEEEEEEDEGSTEGSTDEEGEMEEEEVEHPSTLRLSNTPAKSLRLLIPDRVRRGACGVVATYLTRSVEDICQFILFCESVDEKENVDPQSSSSSSGSWLYGDVDMLIEEFRDRLSMMLPVVSNLFCVDDEKFIESSPSILEKLEVFSHFVPRLLQTCQKFRVLSNEDANGCMWKIADMWNVSRTARFFGRVISNGRSVTAGSFKRWLGWLTQEQLHRIASKMVRLVNKYAESLVFYYDFSDKLALQALLDLVLDCSDIVDGLPFSTLQILANRIGDMCHRCARNGRPLTLTAISMGHLTSIFRDHMSILEHPQFVEATGVQITARSQVSTPGLEYLSHTGDRAATVFGAEQ